MIYYQDNDGHKQDLWGKDNTSRGSNKRKKSIKHHWINDTITNWLHNFNIKMEQVSNIFNNNNNNKNKKKLNNLFVFLILFTIIIVWSISGFYTVKESDRGVVFYFGKYSHIVEPGLNWRPLFIQKIIPVNVETIREQATKGMMLTSDENVIQVEMNVQYRITEPDQYLFNVVNPDNSLHQAIDSAVRGIIGKSAMEQILTTRRAFIRNETQKELENMIEPYHMGISILDVNFQAARPPEAVKAAFDDVIAAREEEQKTIREAEAYSNEVLPLAKGNAQKLIEEAMAYKTSIVFKAQGEISSFSKILPEYRAAPKITRERLYIETMERILGNTRKVIINNNNSIVMLSLDNILKNKIINKLKTKSKLLSTSNNVSDKNHNSSVKPIYLNNSNLSDNFNFKNKKSFHIGR